PGCVVPSITTGAETVRAVPNTVMVCVPSGLAQVDDGQFESARQICPAFSPPAQRLISKVMVDCPAPKFASPRAARRLQKPLACAQTQLCTASGVSAVVLTT